MKKQVTCPDCGEIKYESLYRTAEVVLAIHRRYFHEEDK